MEQVNSFINWVLKNSGEKMTKHTEEMGVRMTKIDEASRKKAETRVGLESRLAVAEAQLRTHTGTLGGESAEDSVVVAGLRVQVASVAQQYHRKQVGRYNQKPLNKEWPWRITGIGMTRVSPMTR